MELLWKLKSYIYKEVIIIILVVIIFLKIGTALSNSVYMAHHMPA